MPSEYKFPARTEHHCEPCEFLKRKNMICSRLDGIKCDYVCIHPESFNAIPLSENTETAKRQIELRASNAKHGRFIGKNDKQPCWCPLLAVKG